MSESETREGATPPERRSGNSKLVVEDGNIVVKRTSTTAPAAAPEAVPGQWKCDQCGFVLVTVAINPATGASGPQTVIAQGDCPNDGTPMRSLTWRELAIAQRDGQKFLEGRMLELSDENDRLHAERRTLEEELAAMPVRVHGVTWLLIRDGSVLLERCAKKAKVLGVGEWFVPGGKIEGNETPIEACAREIREEWGAYLRSATPFPILEGSPVPPGPRGLFLMRPFLVAIDSEPPACTLDEGVPLRWVSIVEALCSPVPQVRMMVAAALSPPSVTIGATHLL